MTDWHRNGLLHAVFEDKVAALRAEVLESHFWRDLTNLAGFASGLLWFVVENGLHVNPGDPLLVTVASMVTSIEEEVIERVRRYDASIPLTKEGLGGSAGKVEVEALQRMQSILWTTSQGAPGVTSHIYIIAATTIGETALTALCGPTAPAPLVDQLMRSVTTLGLPGHALRPLAHPWRLRDDAPGDVRVRAFEAALVVGHREFAYDLFADKNP